MVTGSLAVVGRRQARDAARREEERERALQQQAEAEAARLREEKRAAKIAKRRAAARASERGTDTSAARAGVRVKDEGQARQRKGTADKSVTVSLVDDDGGAPAPAARGNQPAQATAKSHRAAGDRSAAAPSAAAHAAVADMDDEDVALGYIISRCVGIQHYHGNGVRYDKEPLILKREPNNPYDPNAVGTFTTIGHRQVGHVQRVDALALSRVADDRTMGIRMIGQVESGAWQVYKFPLRITFFGARKWQERVAKRLVEYGGPVLMPPKSKKRDRGRIGSTAGRSAPQLASSRRGGGSLADAGAREATGNHDGVEFAGERTWEDRDAELRAQAVVLE